MNWERVLLTLLLSLATRVAAQDTQTYDAEQFADRARKAMDIRLTGSKSFRLTYRFHFVRPKTNESAEGEYRELWKSPDQWRREISYSDFQQVEVGGKDRRWVLRDLALEPPEVRVMRDLARIPRLGIDSETRFSRVRDRPPETQCIKLHLEPEERILCFDANSGVLVRDEGSALTCDYSDFQNFGEKSYPRKLSCSDKTGLTIEGTVSELSEDPPTGDPARFASLPGATEWPVCDTIVPPQPLHYWGYPGLNERMALAIGARVSVTIGVDGKTSNVKIVRSVGHFRDGGAISAAKRWKFKPATCAGVPIPFPLEVVFR